ncbi:hypothetical protein [Crocinitomix catalasitica]|uniref:hypothetical protein n=1 Tax=Crocinitomix catalasitica TaxID=184607 RepID=UPI0012FC3381|nr:hypothetical protein [Crocinitomix catalasitica]
MNIKLKNTVLTFCLFFMVVKVSGQCPDMDATFTVSDITIEVGETLIVTYTGVSEDCETCTGLLSFGEIGEPDQERLDFSTGEIIGKYIYSEAGTYEVDFEIINEDPCDGDGSTITVTVVNPSGCPLALFKDRGPICYPYWDPYDDYEIETTPLGGFSINDVNWMMGEDGDIINTGTSLELSYAFELPGAYSMSATVEFIIGGIPCIQDVQYIENGTSLETFIGMYPYSEINLIGASADFEILPFIYGPSDNLIQFRFSEYIFDPYTGLGPFIFETFIWSESFEVVNVLDDDSPIGSVAGSFVEDEIILNLENLEAGTYSANWEFSLTSTIGYCVSSKTLNFIIPHNDSLPEPCDSCNSFRPDIGKRYWMSAWVHVDEGQVKTFNPENYASGEDIDPLEVEDAYVEFYFVGPNTSTYFFPTGDIIDGWQRIVGEFTIPDMTTDFEVKFGADETDTTYFDDIRIHPFNGSMKSYVYDKETFWLLSELDDNNYATFYEYDQEGGLIRIKKETSKGIVTIQETRSGTIKKD